MKAKLYIAIIFAILTILGVLRCFGGMQSVNPGIFIFPGIIAAVFFLWYIKGQKQSK